MDGGGRTSLGRGFRGCSRKEQWRKTEGEMARRTLLSLCKKS